MCTVLGATIGLILCIVSLFEKKEKGKMLKVIFSFIFDKITDPLTLPIKPLYEWIILGVIGLIAYIVAFCIVGDMYKDGYIDDKFLGSLFHWVIRLLIFIPVWFIVYWVIVIAQWIIAHWVLALCFLGGLIVLIVAISGAFFYFGSQKE